jgi:hypothetical protein
MRLYADTDLFKAIKDGGPAALVSYNMPPWGAILTNEQIDDVLASAHCDWNGEPQLSQKRAAGRFSTPHFGQRMFT